MKQWVWFLLFVVLPWLALGCGKGAEGTAEEKKETKHEVHKVEASTKPQEVKKGLDLETELKGLTMEAIQKEGKVKEIAPGTVQISPERQQLIGVKFGTVEMKTLEKVIRTVGRVEFDEKRIVTVSPKIGGWIEELYVDFTGRSVRQGEPLLTIYSPELVSTQEEYLLALRAQKDFGRSSFPEVAGSGKALAEAAKRRLKLWDISEDQIRALEESGQPQKTLTLHAPYSGVVLEKMAYKGMNVMPGMALFKIADLSVVWLIADIYEYELPFIRLGQQAAVRITSFPGETFRGKAVYIYPTLNGETRTAKVRFEFPNPYGKLKPEMYANVELKVYLGKKLAVPESAVIDTGARQVVIIDRGNGYFEPREVRVGSKVDDFYEVVSGLKAGERVVTSAAFLIDSESKFKEAVGGHTHSH